MAGDGDDKPGCRDLSANEPLQTDPQQGLENEWLASHPRPRDQDAIQKAEGFERNWGQPPDTLTEPHGLSFEEFAKAWEMREDGHSWDRIARTLKMRTWRVRSAFTAMQPLKVYVPRAPTGDPGLCGCHHAHGRDGHEIISGNLKAFEDLKCRWCQVSLTELWNEPRKCSGLRGTRQRNKARTKKPKKSKRKARNGQR